MANTINTLNGLSLTAIAEETLPVLQKKAAILSAFTTDFSPAPAEAFSAIATRIPTAMTASIYDASSGYAAVAGSTTAVTVTLDQHVYRTVGFTPVEIGNVGMSKLQTTFITPAVNSVVNAMLGSLWSIVTVANYPFSSFNASGSSFTFADVLAGCKNLDNSGSLTPRSAILNVNLYHPLLNELKANYLIGDTSLVRDGQIGSLAGVNVYMDQQMPYASPGLGGIVAGKDAIAIAARLPYTAGAPGVETEVVTDPNSGLSIQLQKYYVPHLGQWHLTATAIYGVQVAQKASLNRFVVL